MADPGAYSENAMTPRARRDSSGSPRYAFANWLFLRLLGVVYLFAFWSLAQQVQLLNGHDGILPASEYLSEARVWADASGIGWDRYRLLPTVFWFGTSDWFLQIVPVAVTRSQSRRVRCVTKCTRLLSDR